MSTSRECEFIETSPNNWFYILESYNAPKHGWNWRDYADCFGPFKSQDAAREHLRDNHSNPGGASVIPHDRFQMTAEYTRLIAYTNRP